MSTFSIGTYLNCLKGKISGHTGSGDSGVFIMQTICNDPEVLVDIQEKHISSLVNRNENLNQNIVDGAAKDSVCKRVRENFKKDIYPKIIPILFHDVCNNLIKELEKGTNVSKPTYDALKKKYSEGEYSLFLSDTFIYACLQLNKEENAVLTEDIPLLQEVDYCCPICHKPLSRDVRGIPIREYQIVNIFDEGYGLSSTVRKPQSLTNDLNKIALCPTHYSEYFDNVNEESYIAMLKLKESLIVKSEAQRKVQSIKLQRQIGDIVEQLKEDKEFTDFSFGRNTTTEVKNKITDNYLAVEIEALVNQRFDSIMKMFSQMKSVKFEETRTKIHNAFVAYDEAGFTQKEIIEKLTDWILLNTSLDSDYEMAAKVVVAFFIQLCEVFYAIS